MGRLIRGVRGRILLVEEARFGLNQVLDLLERVGWRKGMAFIPMLARGQWEVRFATRGARRAVVTRVGKPDFSGMIRSIAGRHVAPSNKKVKHEAQADMLHDH